jgi:hypothetical protein
MKYFTVLEDKNLCQCYKYYIKMHYYAGMGTYIHT